MEQKQLCYPEAFENRRQIPRRQEDRRLLARGQELESRKENAVRHAANYSLLMRDVLQVMQGYMGFVKDEMTQLFSRLPKETSESDDILRKQTMCCEVLEKMTQVTNRMTDYLSRFSDLTKAVADELPFTPCRVAELVEDAIETLRSDCPGEEEGIRIRTQGLEDLPPILANEEQLVAVFYNLLRRAIVGEPPRGSIIVSGQMDASNRAVLINVTDTTYCMPPDVLASTRQRLVDVDSAQTKTDEISPARGGPLSLAICKAGVHAHGGEVAVDSAEGMGTTFIVRLPLETPQSLAHWKLS